MNPSPDIQIAFTCDVCDQEKIENAFTVHRRCNELGAHVCRECYDEADAEVWWVLKGESCKPVVIGLVVDVNCALTVAGDPVADPYTRTAWVEEYRPPVMYAASYERWIMLFLGLLTIAVGVAAAALWRGV